VKLIVLLFGIGKYSERAKRKGGCSIFSREFETFISVHENVLSNIVKDVILPE